VTDADTFFEQEFPALQQWSFREEDAKRIIQPVLAVVGALSLERDPIWGERQRLLLDWLPDVEPFVLPRATHLLEVENLEILPSNWLDFLLATRSPQVRNTRNVGALRTRAWPNGRPRPNRRCTRRLRRPQLIGRALGPDNRRSVPRTP